MAPRPSRPNRGEEPLRVLVPVGSAALGGSELALLRLIDACPRDRARFSAWIFAPSAGPLEQALAAREIPWRRFPRATLRTPWGMARLARELERARPQLLYLHASRVLALLARAAGIPCLERVNMPRARGAGGWCRYALVDRLLTRADTLVLPVSQALADELAGRGVAREKLRVLRDAIDPAPWRAARERREQARAALGIPAGALLALNAGRLVPQKAQADFVAAASLLAGEDERWRFVIAGDGPLREALAAQVARLGLEPRLEMLPHRADITDLFAAADLYIQTSLWEGLAMVLPEAMATGLAIVATDVGGTREALDRYPRGACVAPRDTAGMARAARALLAAPAVDLPAFPEMFTPAEVARRFVAIAREAITSASRGAS